MDVPDALVRQGVDRLGAAIAILDDEGTIRYTNDAWKQFATEGGYAGEPARLGESYLEVCRGVRNSDEYARQALEGLEATLAGERERFGHEYPCPDPVEAHRWFRIEATGFAYEGGTYVLVAHTDITERRREAQRARERTEILAGVASFLSHDLKNPMSAALAWGEVIETHPESANVDRMRSSLGRLEKMIDRTLVLARETAVRELETVDVGESARHVWETLPTGEVTLEVTPVPPVRADGRLVRLIFENLFRNALEHTGADVTVRVGPLPGTEERFLTGFYVEDDGPGIPEERREEVFETGVSSHSTDENTGLGLAIVRGSVGAHGWAIELTESESGGARFEISDVARAQTD